MYLSQAKRPVKLLSIVVFVICAFAGAAAAMYLFAAIFAPDGNMTNKFAVLGYFAIAFLASLATGIGGVVLLGRFRPRYAAREA
ncbi:MAG: hypothetical protein M1539_06730 [Actinobacteria bacterium]|nr:hypothetical protein [Actinomycetota bacterium]MCL5883649.1 hypothetical protein [Actinomycetota bacterium]